MRDLEIRGAGNLLGEEQSGHVAAVGFELYCQMLDEAVTSLAGTEEEDEAWEPVRLDVPVDAYVPADYIPYEVAKIDVHRRIASARERDELEANRRRARRPLRPPARAGREPDQLQARASSSAGQGRGRSSLEPGG